MPDMRKEKDSLGFVEVPANAYFGAQTRRAMDNFPISEIRPHPQLVRALGMIKRAPRPWLKKLNDHWMNTSSRFWNPIR